MSDNENIIYRGNQLISVKDKLYFIPYSDPEHDDPLGVVECDNIRYDCYFNFINNKVYIGIIEFEDTLIYLKPTEEYIRYKECLFFKLKHNGENFYILNNYKVY